MGITFTVLVNVICDNSHVSELKVEEIERIYSTFVKISLLFLLKGKCHKLIELIVSSGEYFRWLKKFDGVSTPLGTETPVCHKHTQWSLPVRRVYKF